MPNKRSLFSFAPIGLFILLMPFYIFPPGSPQPADFLMVLIAAATMFTLPIEATKRARQTTAFLLIFAFWTIIVNGFVSITSSEFVLRSSTFFIYNSVLFYSIYRHYKYYGSEFLVFVAKMVCVSLIFQGIIGVGGFYPGRNSIRGTLFFNNPNQLGYWTLLSMSLLGLAHTRFRISPWLLIPALLFGLFLTAFCLSKAANISLAFLLLLMGMKRPWILVAVGVLAVGYVATPAGSGTVDKLQHRLATIGDQDDDSADGRHYDRIFNNPSYWVLGSGQGDYERFETVVGKDQEIHSSPGTLFFCYGMFGVGLFATFFFSIFGRSLRLWSYAVPLMLYGFTHDGLRFTSMWLFLAFAFCLSEQLRLDELQPEEMASSPPSPTLAMEPVNA